MSPLERAWARRRISPPACEACGSSRNWMRELDSDDSGRRYVDYKCKCGSAPDEDDARELDAYFDQLIGELHGL